MPYFERLDDHRFQPTPSTGGAWQTDELHIGPVLGLLAHLIEVDRERRGRDEMVVARLSYDILGPIPAQPLTTSVEVTRPGRTGELVEARAAYGDRVGLVVRAWLIKRHDSAAIAVDHAAPLPPREGMERWDPTTVWPGGFVATVTIHRQLRAPGDAAFWLRVDQPLLEGEAVSPVARAAGLVDLANGMTAPADPEKVLFPNLDATLHLFRSPQGEWLGFDTTVTFGPGGVGLTSTELHDQQGRVGSLRQILTVRER